MQIVAIKNPEYLKDRAAASIKTLSSYLAGRYPDTITGWLLVAACRSILRAIYGSDEEATTAMIKWTKENVDLDEAYKDITTDIQ